MRTSAASDGYMYCTIVYQTLGNFLGSPISFHKNLFVRKRSHAN